MAATSLSEGADAALRQGHAIASELGVAFIACHVLPEAFSVRVPFPHETGIDSAVHVDIERRARAILRDRLGVVIGAAANLVRIEIESGTAHAGILTAAERVGAGLVVVGAGATAQRVARSAGVPVLIARPSPAGGAILGATDFSDPSLPAVTMAISEAKRRQGPLRLLHCLDIDENPFPSAGGLSGLAAVQPLPLPVIARFESTAREWLADAMAAAGVEGDTVVARRPAAAGIIEEAQTVATALVVVGTRGRTGLARLALGSVAEEVVSRAPCSVLVVRLEPAV
jgi:nucleotide-binding universal stress UspA family protein